MIDDKPISGHVQTSTVHRKGSKVHGKECLAYRTNTDNKVLTVPEYNAFKALGKVEKVASGIDLGHCGACRACWSKEVANISYPLHWNQINNIEKGLKMNTRKIIRQKTIARNADKSVLLVLILGGLAGIAPWMIVALGQYVGALWKDWLN
jgi:hypothetical protein